MLKYLEMKWGPKILKKSLYHTTLLVHSYIMKVVLRVFAKGNVAVNEHVGLASLKGDRYAFESSVDRFVLF